MRGITCVLALLLPATAGATDYISPAFIHGALQGGDYWTSDRFRLTGGRVVEGNQLVAKVGLGPAKLGTFALTYGADVGVQKLQGKRRWPVWVYRGVVGGLYGAAIVRNHRLVEEHKVRP